MKRALIISDLEGITGVYDLNDIKSFIKLYNKEILVCIETLLENNIKNIQVLDFHNEGKYIDDFNKLSSTDKSSVEIIRSLDKIDFDNKIDLAILVGFHGMNESLGILSHTIRHNFKSIKVYSEKFNKWISIGEVELYSRWLSAKGIPVVLVVGDLEACYEGNFFNPYRQTCCVKSLFQKDYLNKEFFYDKIKLSITESIKSNYSKCLAIDDSFVYIEFYNGDLIDQLSESGFTKFKNNIVFKNCESFIKEFYFLISKIQEFDKINYNLNRRFLKEIRVKATHINKNEIRDFNIESILKYKNLFTLDENNRRQLKEYFEKV